MGGSSSKQPEVVKEAAKELSPDDQFLKNAYASFTERAIEGNTDEPDVEEATEITTGDIWYSNEDDASLKQASIADDREGMNSMRLLHMTAAFSSGYLGMRYSQRVVNRNYLRSATAGQVQQSAIVAVAALSFCFYHVHRFGKLQNRVDMLAKRDQMKAAQHGMNARAAFLYAPQFRIPDRKL